MSYVDEMFEKLTKNKLAQSKRDAADDMYNALWEDVELSDRTLPPSGRTAECQRVYDLCRAALKKAEGE